MTARWQAAVDATALTDAQARALVACVAVVITAGLAALVWGDRAVTTVLAAAVVWLLWKVATLHDRCDQTADDVDRALGRVEALEHHLHDAAPAGRHHHRQDTAA